MSPKPRPRPAAQQASGGSGSVAAVQPPTSASPTGRRLAAFAAISGTLILAAAGYLAVAVLREPPRPGPPAAAASSPILAQPHLLYLIPSGGDPTQNRVAATSLSGASANRISVDLKCGRVYFAGGHGVCLGRSATGQETLSLFGADFKPSRTVLQPGLGSRARVSNDGRWAAATVFLSGDSYSSPAFSTRTVIYQVADGSGADLESYAVERKGRRMESPDFNFWGVTFAPSPSGHFYATLWTGGHIYLVEGDATRKTATVVSDDIECPSLSPDGTRIAYKSRFGDAQGWRLHVLDLRTMADTPLAETRTVDDQAEWLDNRHVLYGLPVPGVPDRDIWSVPADGTGRPVKFLAHAFSPAVVR
jgi:hypothetical protein